MADESSTSSEDIFPKPGRLIHNIFRCCGSCPRCIAKQSQMETEIEKTSIKRCVENEERGASGKMLNEEYILICSSGKAPPIFSQMTSNNPPGYYISNYGRQFIISDHGRGCMLNGGTGVGWDINETEIKKLSSLTQEFINYYNSIDFWGGQWNHIFRREDSEQMIREYQKKTKMEIAYKIEIDKREIQKMTSELQKKETEMVNQKEHLKSVEDKLVLQETTLKENEQKLKEQINNHKQKSLKLFERENNISVKGSVETILKELLEISSSISSILEVTDSPILVNRVDQIIARLDHIKSSGGSTIQVDEGVIIATEVLPEPSAPQPGSWMEGIDQPSQQNEAEGRGHAFEPGSGRKKKTFDCLPQKILTQDDTAIIVDVLEEVYLADIVSGLVFTMVDSDNEEPVEVGQWDANARRIRFYSHHLKWIFAVYDVEQTGLLPGERLVSAMTRVATPDSIEQRRKQFASGKAVRHRGGQAVISQRHWWDWFQRRRRGGLIMSVFRAQIRASGT